MIPSILSVYILYLSVSVDAVSVNFVFCRSGVMYSQRYWKQMYFEALEIVRKVSCFSPIEFLFYFYMIFNLMWFVFMIYC